MDLKNWAIKNKKTIYWIFGILLALTILFPEQIINIGSQSIIEGAFTTFTIGLVVLLLGLIMLFIPGLGLPGLIGIIVGIFATFGGSLFGLIELFSGTTGIVLAIVSIVVLIIMFKK